MTRRKSPQGFTLIELLLVLVILAVLAAVVVPKFTNRSKDAKIKAATTDISMLETALDAYEVDNGGYPSTQDGLQALLEAPSGEKNWKGPYIKKLPTDPWGDPYIYVAPGTHNPSGVDISSWGPDKHEGGEGQLDNWSTPQ
jgi:general secretion pathway protein G